MNVTLKSGYKSPVNILFVHSSASHYGSDAALFNMIKGLDRNRFRAIVVVPEDGVLVTRLRNIGVQVKCLPLAVMHRSFAFSFWLGFFKRLLLNIRILLQLAREENINLIHSNTSHVFDGAVLAKIAGLPHIWHIREINIWQSVIAPFLRVLLPRLATRIVCVSKATQTSFAAAPIFANKLRVIYDGIDLDTFNSQISPCGFRQSLELTNDHLLIGLAGRIVSYKGHELFIQAAELVRHDFPNVRFVIVGDALTQKDQQFREKLKQIISQKRLNDLVLFAGAYVDIANIMTDIDILMVPTINVEAWGLVALEGMALGKPVVASNSGGPKEIIDSGNNGFLFDVENLASLQAILLRLLASPELRRSIGASAYSSVVNNFTIEKTVVEVANLYDEILQELAFER